MVVCDMCLFEYDEKKHIEGERADAEARGRKKEKIRLLAKFTKDGILTIEKAAKEAGISVEEFEKILAEN